MSKRHFALRFFFVGAPTPSSRLFPFLEGRGRTGTGIDQHFVVAFAPCVIPSEAEGPRIFLDVSRPTPNHGSTAGV